MRTSFVRGLLIIVGAIALSAASARSEERPPALPRLVDLGSGTCIPCRQMKPILDELGQDYADRFETVFIDIRERRDEAARWRIRVIPTQIFLAPDGTELFRHEGFYAKKDILAKWRELGFPVDGPQPAAE